MINKILDALRRIFIMSLSILSLSGISKAQNKFDVIRDWIQFSDAPNSLYHYLANQAYDQLNKRDSLIARLHTLSDWQQRQKWIQKTLESIVGPFPKKTPLNARVVKTIYKESYKVEDIIYESQPKFYVTSALFIPAGIKGRAPAIIYCSGHTSNGYRSPVYLHTIINLVNKGFIVFAFDPVDQGERDEYYDSTTGHSVILYKDPRTGKFIRGAPDVDHSYSGAQAFITGSSQALYMVWDGIRAIDYLLTRKEVDPARVGITGRSGGGTQTAYIAAMDDRIKAAAPGNYITNFTRLIQSAGPQDAEQDLFNAIKRGIDIADLLLVRAPKPTLMITTTRDQDFSIQGSIETAEEVSRIYKAYGKSSNFRMETDDAPHAVTKKGLEAMYAFFQKFLDNPGDSTDEDVQPLSAEELQVTKTGQVSTSIGGETVFSLNRNVAEKLENKLQAKRKHLPGYFSGILRSAKELSGYQEPLEIGKPVFTGRFQMDGYVIEKYFIKGEGNYVIPYLLMVPDEPNHKALIYLNPSGKSAEASPGEEMEWFVKKGFTVLAPDLLGIGEMGPGDFHGDSYIGGVSYNVWYLSMLIGRSIVGIQAGDVIRLTRLLEKNTGISKVYGLAKKEMAPVLLHAAAFDTTITHIALIEPYSSYRSFVMNRFYNPAFIHSAVPGALKSYDLPDLAASLAPRKLLVVGITDGSGSSDPKNILEDISVINTGYNYRKADTQLSIISKVSVEEPYSSIYIDWIK